MSEKVIFNGFGKSSLKFLKAIGFHQDRDWFKENKSIYMAEVREPMGDLIEALAARFDKAKIPLTGDRKKSLYRVNRDIRFSKNKDPYVTHASAMLTRSGGRKDNGFVYMHYSNERCFIATGFYGLEGAALRTFREMLIREEAKYKKINKSMTKHGYVFEDDSKLKRNPRGFEKLTGEPITSWVRMKNHTYLEELTPEIFQSGEVEDRMFKMTKHAMPLLEFGWRAIDSVRASNET